MTLRTRKPTGLVPYPLVLLAGPEKSGKTYSAFALTASPRVGRSFVFDIGEGGADEYAELGNYEIVEHNGTYSDIAAQVEAACAEPSDPARPNVIIFDSATNLWQLLKDEASKTAAKRGKSDPTMDLWNKANDRWRRIIDALIQFPGIAVVTSRAGDVADVEDGKPTGERIWKVRAQKDLPYDANVVIRTTGAGQAEISGVRSLHLHIPAGRTLPVPGFTLEKVIFDMMKAGGGVRDFKPLAADEIPIPSAKKALFEDFLAAGWSQADAKVQAGKLWGGRCGEAISQTELDKLRASITSPPAIDGPAADGGPEPVPDLMAALEESLGMKPGPTISTKEAQHIHILASSKNEPGIPIDEHTLDVLIFGITGGRTDSAKQLTSREAAHVETAIAAARDGRLPTHYQTVEATYTDWLDQRAEAVAS